MHILEAEAAPLSTERIQPQQTVEPQIARVIGRVTSTEPGPTLICIAAVHGNEPAGLKALENVFARLERRPGLVTGELIGLVGNRQALARGCRFVDRDLNRLWLPSRIGRLAAGGPSEIAEDDELRGLHREIVAVVGAARGGLFLLDLHTISGPGPAFVVLEDTLPNRTFGLTLEGPLVLGLEEELSGTLLGYAAAMGITSVSFESGQHEQADSVTRAEEAIVRAMIAAGLVSREAAGGLVSHAVSPLDPALPEVVEIRYRHAIAEGDDFRMDPGFESFQRVKAGQVIASDRNGPVRSPMSGRLLMPLYQELGDDGFFIVRRVEPFWLRLSAGVRRLRLERAVHWMPGVRRHPEVPGAFIVDRRLARWLVLEIFHLMGFRRQGRLGRFVVLARRPYDRSE